jgi:prolyl-tRNA editing enzyme YbaK/EbsC (Cys-tRNA(Pro) deacylase)
MTNFAALQQKAIEVRERQLQIDEANALATAKKIELKEKEVAATLLAEENRIMIADLFKMDLGTRAWFEKRQRLILSRDD